MKEREQDRERIKELERDKAKLMEDIHSIRERAGSLEKSLTKVHLCKMMHGLTKHSYINSLFLHFLFKQSTKEEIERQVKMPEEGS